MQFGLSVPFIEHAVLNRAKSVYRPFNSAFWAFARNM